MTQTTTELQIPIEIGKKIKVMMVDDHHSARQAYSAFLNGEDNIQVVAQAGNGLELINYLESNAVQPDVIILDIQMPVMSGSQALPIVNERFPGIKVIVLSMNYEEEYIADMLVKGASAFLPKSCKLETLIQTIHDVYSEGYHFSKSVAQIVVSSLMEQTNTKPIFKQLLSEREIEVLKLICDGKSRKQIAERLFISPDTIKAHIKNIYRKLNIRGTIPLLKYAIKNGIIDLEI